MNMSKITKITTSFLLIFFLVSLFGVNSLLAGGVLEKIKKEGTIVVGIAQTTPGAFKDVKTGEWTGIHIDVAKELAKFMGAELKIVETSWSLFISGLNSGAFDVYMPGTFYTGKRALQVAYSTPAYFKGVSGVVRADDSRFQSIRDFDRSDVKIAVRLGAVEAELAPKFFPKANILEFNTNEAPTIAEAVKVGNADVWLADEVLQSSYLKKNSWAKRAGEAFGKYPIGYVVRYGDQDWLSYLNSFVSFMRSSGQMRVFVTRYGQDASTLSYTP
jgi:ABC-type amino acid transport substrate-binding protein